MWLKEMKDTNTHTLTKHKVLREGGVYSHVVVTCHMHSGHMNMVLGE
jgi:hypothetical protein